MSNRYSYEEGEQLGGRVLRKYKENRGYRILFLFYAIPLFIPAIACGLGVVKIIQKKGLTVHDYYVGFQWSLVLVMIGCVILIAGYFFCRMITPITIYENGISFGTGRKPFLKFSDISRISRKYNIKGLQELYFHSTDGAITWLNIAPIECDDVINLIKEFLPPTVIIDKKW